MKENGNKFGCKDTCADKPIKVITYSSELECQDYYQLLAGWKVDCNKAPIIPILVLCHKQVKIHEMESMF